MTTTARESYKNPASLSKPVLRERDPSAKVNFAETLNSRPATAGQSGYISNRLKFDDKGFTFAKGWNGDMRKTEYRDRYNKPKPFHREDIKINDGKLKKRFGDLPSIQWIHD